MRKGLAALGVASALVGSGVVIGVMVPASSQQGGATITACVRNRGGYTKNVDVGKKRFSAGDYLLETDPLRNPESGKVVGHSVVKLTFVKLFPKRNDVLFIVDSTDRFAKGKISTYGYGRFSAGRKGLKIAIIGGTGIYNQARGAALVKFGRCAGKPGTRITYNLRA
jgi:hypothetical protein